MFRGRLERLLNVLCTSNFHPVSMGKGDLCSLNEGFVTTMCYIIALSVAIELINYELLI